MQLRSIRILLIAAALLGQFAPGAMARNDGSLMAAGEGDFLWTLSSPRRGEFTLLYRTARTANNTLYTAIKQGVGDPIALSAHGSTAYIVYRDYSVQSVVYRQTDPPTLEPFEVNQLPPIKYSGRMLGFEATRTGPVALLREGGDAEGLWLLALKRGEWQTLSLPRSLKPAAVKMLAAPDPTGDIIALLAWEDEGKRTLIHRLSAGAWTSESFDWQLVDGAVSLAVQRNLFLVQPVERQSNQLTLALMRGSKPPILGTLGLSDQFSAWSASADGDRIAILASTRPAKSETRADPILAWTHYHIHHATDEQPVFNPLTIADGPLLMQYVLQIVIVLIVAVTMIFLLARNQPRRREQTPRLPPTLIPAALPRITAAVIDLAAPGLVTMWLYAIGNPTQLLRELWTGSAVEFVQLQPALVFIGLFTLHTTLTELFTAATLGKFITGCRVVNHTGGPPHLWQVLARNLYKIVEITYPILLIMPMLSAHYLRLGDLVAGTTVVTPRPPAASGSADSRSRNDDSSADSNSP